MSKYDEDMDRQMMAWYNDQSNYDLDAPIDYDAVNQQLAGNPVAPRTDIEYREYIPSHKGCCGQNIAVGLIGLVAVAGCIARAIRH